MHVLVVSFERLRKQYGEPSLARIRRRIELLVVARARKGIESLVLEVERGLADLDVAAAEAEPESIREQLLDLADALEERGQALESVLLIGGPAALPFHELGNPLADPDSSVFADYPYGARMRGALLTDWPVGRLPAGEASPESLLRLLSLAAWHQRGVPSATRRTVGYSTGAWERASRQVYGSLEERGRLLLSPPLSAESLERRRFAGASIVYCNLHGLASAPNWYGQGAGKGQLLVALRPQNLSELPLLGALVCSEACYGAYSPEYDLDASLAMRFLLQGAACFVGATTISYGPVGPPLSEADLLAHALLQAASRRGRSVGAVFQQARRRTYEQALRAQGFLDEDDVKTLAQFILYGDPTVVLA